MNSDRKSSFVHLPCTVAEFYHLQVYGDKPPTINPSNNVTGDSSFPHYAGRTHKGQVIAQHGSKQLAPKSVLITTSPSCLSKTQ